VAGTLENSEAFVETVRVEVVRDDDGDTALAVARLK
jgi:hypothetical protein